MLLEAWRDFEREDGDEKSQAEVQLFIDIGLLIHICFPPNKRLLLKVSQIEIQPFYISFIAGASASAKEGEEETEGPGRGWK